MTLRSRQHHRGHAAAAGDPPALSGSRLVFLTFQSNEGLLRRLGLCTDIRIIRTRSPIHFVLDTLGTLLWMQRQDVDAAILRVLRPGGRMVFAEPNMMNPQIFVQKSVRIIKRWLGDTPHETAFVRWSIARRLRRAGYTRVNVFPFDFLHPLTPRPLIEGVSRVGAWFERIPILREIAGSCLIVAEKPA